jgi:ferredoxin
MDLNGTLSAPVVEVASIARTDHGHFAGSEEAFRHWDEEGVVPADCVKCHTAVGLPLFLNEGTTVSANPSNGLECSTCHSDLTTFTLHEVEQVEFPSGAVLGFEDSLPSNLCLECHQGRESTVSVNNLIEGLDVNSTSDQLRFLNVHYFAASATLFGSEAMGAYQYEGKDYVGQFAHVPNFDTCIECHNAHALQVEVEACGGCHQGVESEEDLRSIRMASEDFDGDGDTEEGIAGEIETMREALYAALQAYSADVAGTPIIYNPASYPYYFTDANGNGELDEDEANADNAYNTWTPRLLQAAYNYQYTTKDPGTFAHNAKYILQVLYDSLEDLSSDIEVDMSGMIRPES